MSMSFLKTISECIDLLSIDGENTKAAVKQKLEEIKLEICFKEEISNVYHNGRFFCCPSCDQQLTETILHEMKHCFNCGKNIGWNVWDPEKNRLKKGVKRNDL